MTLSIKRIYEPPAQQDGYRVLIDRLWPRGISKEKARIDLWLREIAPSTELRQWFDHDPAKWQSFCARYRLELDGKPELLASLKQQARQGRVTLLYSAQDEQFNQAVALREFLGKAAARKSPGAKKKS